ncbi:MAG: 16S rRNA (adenine(1518)-N(6)/adenine(1519)-N(6))-dimethyltransferase RsmA [Verrucomicrobiota bacterium]|nr:16S rRNA (adenine(1518)-N(6)/adenine(1519)-N(6))-dimethyltransferase RsmA [Verrucomicrobiota bacterium]
MSVLSDTPLSLTATRELLEQLEHLPKKKLGQNFLVDGNIVRKSIELAELDANSCVVEIGPGLGTLTKAILKSGASIWAVERDATLAEHLRTYFSDELKILPIINGSSPAKQSILQLIEGDCLDYPFAGLPQATAVTGYKIVANLPYAVSTPWIEAVIAGELPERMVLMLQKEAGDRYTATHGSKAFGAISIFLQSAFNVHSKHLVSAQCFHPAPKVDSVLLRLDRKTDVIHFKLAARECIRRIFTQRRKQLGALCKNDSQAGALIWFNKLLKQGISPTVRPEELAIRHWQSITRFVD